MSTRSSIPVASDDGHAVDDGEDGFIVCCMIIRPRIDKQIVSIKDAPVLEGRPYDPERHFPFCEERKLRHHDDFSIRWLDRSSCRNQPADGNLHAMQNHSMKRLQMSAERFWKGKGRRCARDTITGAKPDERI